MQMPWVFALPSCACSNLSTCGIFHFAHFKFLEQCASCQGSRQILSRRQHVPKKRCALNNYVCLITRFYSTVLFQIKCMIQSSTKNSILGIYGRILSWSNLPQYQEWTLSVVPILWQQRVVKNNFQEREYRISSIRRHRYSLHVSVQLLFEGGVYFIGKPADLNDGWILKVRTSDTVTTVRCWQLYTQPLSSAVSHGKELYNMNSPSVSPVTVVRIIRIRMWAPRIVSAGTIPPLCCKWRKAGRGLGTRLLHSYVWWMFAFLRMMKRVIMQASPTNWE